MSARRRLFAPLLIVALALGLANARVEASDKSFSSIVKHIESHYNAKRQGTFGMINFARFLVKVIRPAGVKNFKVVMFKQLDFSRFPGEVGFHQYISDNVHPSWTPMAKISQRGSKQWVYVYFQQEDEHAKFLVVAMQQKQAFVVQFKFDPEKLARFMEDPKIMGISLTGKKDHDDQNNQNPPADAPGNKGTGEQGNKKQSPDL